MRSAIWLLSAVLAFSCLGCFLSRAGTNRPDGSVPDAATGMDANSADAARIDASTPDAMPPPDDAATAPDATMPPDAAGPPDAGALCETYAIAACAASHSDIEDCTRLYDGLETAPRCPTQSRVSMDCRGGDASYCDNSAACSDEDGCVMPFWIRFDLGAPRPVSQVRFMAGWWADRPDLFEIWHSDSPSSVPDSGATMVYSGSAATHPWRCVEGESCSDEVPDGCCPDGRGSTQVTDQSSYTPSCDLGTFFPKFDTASFPEATGRYWYLMVRTGAFDDRIWLNELQLRRGTTCP